MHTAPIGYLNDFIRKVEHATIRGTKHIHVMAP